VNPYNTGQTPLTDKYLGQCNDFYLRGSLGLIDADDFTAEYYSVFGFPPSHFTPIWYAFLELFECNEAPQMEEKQIKTLPRLTSLDPETFVDWYTSMENELLMHGIGLLPFDAITINYQYVRLCIPGVGERKYMVMAKVLYRICDRTLQHELDAVKNAFKNNSCRVRDGYRLIWDIMVTSLPAFCPYKKYPEPQWVVSRDVMTHAKRWILFFRFMGKSYQGYSSSTEQSLHFIRSIQEPALNSQVKSLEVSILNENAQVSLKLKGRAPLPSHLCIDAMAETLAQTTQPLELNLQFAPSTNMTMCGCTHPNNQYGTPVPCNPYIQYGPNGPTPPPNLHVMQGSTAINPMSNWTERTRAGSRGGGGGSSRRFNGDNGGKSRGTRKPREAKKPRVICQACFSPGHDATTCWTLARALLTTQFIRQIVDKDLLNKVMESYKKRFNPPEDALAKWAYCSDNHTTPEHICHQMDWKGLGESRNDSDGDSESDSDGSGRESTDEM
jgi:hypothetical protein